VQNVNTNQRPLERMLGIGSVDFDTAGTDDSDFTFHGVEDPEGIAHRVDHASNEAQRDAVGGGPGGF
jgi:membrane protein YdbS with pleckstrin-like domain